MSEEDDPFGLKRKGGSLKGGKKIMKDDDGNALNKSTSTENSTQFESNEGMNDISNSNKSNDEGHLTKAYEQMFYPDNHPGPFHVLLSSKVEISSRRKNCELFLYEKLEKQKIKMNFTCKNVGYNTFRITLNNAMAANEFVMNPLLSDAGFRAFIPDRFILKFVIIRNVPTYFSAERIKEEIEENNDFDVLTVFRFTRRDDKGLITPTLTVKLGIVSENLPKMIRMFSTIVEADLYIPPLRQCKNCGRLGHIANRCKSMKRCLVCGEPIVCPTGCKEVKCDFCKQTTNCTPVCKSPRCILCNSIDHHAVDASKCSKWKKEKNIREIMALSNKSRKEVMTSYPTENYYDILSDNEYQNQFPKINNKNSEYRDINKEINRRITKISYSKIAATKPKPNFMVPKPITINPIRPVYEYPKYQKVTEIEKILTAFSGQMSAILKAMNCEEGLNILGQFQDSIELNFKKIRRNSTHSISSIPSNIQEPT